MGKTFDLIIGLIMIIFYIINLFLFIIFDDVFYILIATIFLIFSVAYKLNYFESVFVDFMEADLKLHEKELKLHSLILKKKK